MVWADKIPAAQFIGRDAQFPRRLIHGAFQNENRLGPPCAAIGIDRCCVGINARHIQPDRGNIIGARRDLGKQFGLDVLGELRIVGPKVGNAFDLVGDNAVIGIKGDCRCRCQIAPCVVGQHRLGPVRHPFHGPL